MEGFESYFEALSFHYTSWNDILENENIDIKNINASEIAEHNVQLLPRQDVSLYGIIPKMERRSFSSCKQCKHVFNPRDVLLHKNCTLKVKSQHVSHFKKKVKAKKKSPLPLPPLFPIDLEGVSPLDELNTTELHPNSVFIVNASELQPTIVDTSPVLATTSPHLESVGDCSLPSTLSSLMEESLSSDSSVFINSLDKASNNVAPLSHVNSNNHEGSISKKKKCSKSPRESDSNAIYGIVEDSKGPCTRSIKNSNHSSGNDSFHRNKKYPSIESGYFSQNDSQEIPSSIPVMYMPMSPVTAVTPLQIVQKGEMVCLEAPQEVITPKDCPHQVYFTIPEQLNVKMYKTRPKLGSIPLYGARKIGGAIVISKQKLISSKFTSLLNNSQRLNVLKSENKLNLKKISSDKNIGNDMKHIRLSPDVNGFIIHDDVSDGTEDQQNSIHDGKISLMNIK